MHHVHGVAAADGQRIARQRPPVAAFRRPGGADGRAFGAVAAPDGRRSGDRRDQLLRTCSRDAFADHAVQLGSQFAGPCGGVAVQRAAAGAGPGSGRSDCSVRWTAGR